MKRIIGISLAVLAVGCNGIIGNGYTVTGEIKGITDGTNVFLEKQDENTGMSVPIDTVKIEKGKFVFEGETKEPGIHAVRIDKTPGGFFFILEKGDITAKINKDSIGQAKLGGTYNNEELMKFNSNMKGFQKRMMDFQKNNIAKMQEAQKSNDSVVMNQLNKEYGKLQDEMIVANTKYVNENPKSFLSLLLVPSLFNTPNADVVKIKKSFEALDNDLKATTAGKKIQKQVEEYAKAIESKKKVS
ncbi:DUF4369 domain-containing protein [Flavobacterium sp. H122]|uniref:DUF4369 domain-containing protein n=1 Tax=Flavobacterium sp. H122 TaxID=2529860 RepID=UPI0020BE4E6C|nr:DUF4369 domain-containing protein [Flavobacterium sp. H122]